MVYKTVESAMRPPSPNVISGLFVLFSCFSYFSRFTTEATEVNRHFTEAVHKNFANTPLVEAGDEQEGNRKDH